MPFRWFLLTALLFVGCESKLQVELEVATPPPIETNFERLPLILAGIQKTGDVRLYEGLPSDFWEPELLEQELKRKKTIRLQGYPVYEELLAIQGRTRSNSRLCFPTGIRSGNTMIRRNAAASISITASSGRQAKEQLKS